MLTFSLLLLACGVPPTPDDLTDTVEPAPAPWTGSVEGHAVLDDGTPLAGVMLTLCDEVCRLQTTDDEGFFRFTEVGPGTPVLEAFSYPGDPTEGVTRYTRFFDFIPIADGEQVVLDTPRVMTALSTTAPLTGAQDLDLGGLRVRFDADAIGIPGDPLPAFASAVQLGSVALPPERWPQHGLGDWRIVQAWGLAVWDLHLEDGFRVDATLDEPLPPGAEVSFLVADYTYGFSTGLFWQEPATLSPDGTVVSSTQGLDRSTLWMVATR